MKLRVSVALATATAVVFAGVAPVHAQTTDVPTLNEDTVISDGEGLEVTNEEVGDVLDQQGPEQPAEEETTEGGSSGSSEGENSTGFPHSSEDPEKTSSENLSSTLLAWNELSPEAEEAFMWINFIVGVLTVLTQAAVIILPVINAFG